MLLYSTEPEKVVEEVEVELEKEESPVAEEVVMSQAPEFTEVYEDVVSLLEMLSQSNQQTVCNVESYGRI